MILLILFLVAGIITGVLFHKISWIQVTAEKLTTLTVFLLLFTLGLNAGADKYIITHLSTLGITALTIAVFAIAGSLFSALIVYKIISRKTKHEK